MSDPIEFEHSYDSQDQIPEGAPEGLYQENDSGAWVATFAGGKVVEDVEQLRNTNRARRDERNEARAATKAFRAQVDELKTELESLKLERKPGGAESKGAQQRTDDTAIKALQAKHEAELEKLQGALGKMTSGLRSKMYDAAVTGGMPSGMKPEVARNLLKGILRVVPGENGEFELKVFEGADAEHPRMTTASNSAADMSVREYFDKCFADEFADYIPGKGTSGGGSGGDREGAGRPQRKSSSSSISTEDGLNPAKYRAAKAAARKSGTDFVIGE